MSIDVEDYRPVVARRFFGQEFVSGQEVVRDTNIVLDLLAKYGVHATFFVLGEVAEALPELVQAIDRAGHEVASHGYRHLFVREIDKAMFLNEIVPARKRLEDIIGKPVLGHRAPAFSINLDIGWAFDALVEAGYRYDSSIFPIAGRNYGDPTAPAEPFRVTRDVGGLWEFPLPYITILGKRIGVGGGGYLRHFPYAFNRWGLRRINRRRAAVLYLHPDEVTAIPKLEIPHGYPLRRRLKFMIFSYLQDRNRVSVIPKFERLLREFSFDTIQNVYDAVLNGNSIHRDLSV